VTDTGRVPLVAVIIPAFRADDSLGAALRSLIDQSFAAWEAVVVSDDGRDAQDLVARTGVCDPRIITAGTGRVGAGPSAARNVGLAATTAPLVAPLDADDRFRADRLARLVPLALARGAADNVAVVRDADDAPLGRLFAAEAMPAELDGLGFLATSVPMFPVFRRDRCGGGWDEGLRFAEDLAFNLKLLDRLGAIPIDPEPLYQYRVRPGSLTASPDSAAAAERAYTSLLGQLARDGLGLADAALRACCRERLEAKRALNRAFAASGLANFQEFMAAASARPR
jgi:hypothetical protein